MVNLSDCGSHGGRTGGIAIVNHLKLLAVSLTNVGVARIQLRFVSIGVFVERIAIERHAVFVELGPRLKTSVDVVQRGVCRPAGMKKRELFAQWVWKHGQRGTRVQHFTWNNGFLAVQVAT